MAASASEISFPVSGSSTAPGSSPESRRGRADRKKVAAALRTIYTAPTVEAAQTALLAFPPALRKIVYHQQDRATGTWSG